MDDGSVLRVCDVLRVDARRREGVTGGVGAVPRREHAAGDARVLLWDERRVVVRNLDRRVRVHGANFSDIRRGVLQFAVFRAHDQVQEASEVREDVVVVERLSKLFLM